MALDERALRKWEADAKKVVTDLGRKWTASVILSTAPRRPYSTLRPRRVSPDPQPSNAEVLSYLEASGRKIFVLSTTMRASVLRNTLADIRRRGLKNLNAGALMLIVAGHWRREVLARWREGTGIKRPSAEWRRRKVRLGLEPGPARASNQLITAFEKARLIVERRG